MSNFQHMGGAGQMMPQQPLPQRPQGGLAATTQIQNLIYTTLNAQTPNKLLGWQAAVPLPERMALVYNIIGNLRLASSGQANPPTLQKMIELGIQYEKDIFEKSPDKETYKREVDTKVALLVERRALNQANLQQSINLQAQAQAQAQQQQQQQQQQQMMNQGQIQRSVPQQQPPPFHHLQHQMQASPLSGQQTTQMPVGISNEGIPQNLNQTQQQFQMATQQQRPPQQNGGRPPPIPLTQQEQSMVHELTNRLMSQASNEEKNNIRTGVQARMDAQTHQRYQAQGIDPFMIYFRNKAIARVRQDKMARMAQAQQQQQQASQQTQNMAPGAPPMQPQRSMNPSPLNNAQPPVSSGTDPTSFLGNMENIIGQQQQAGVMAQEAGQMVVPASNAQRNATPQPNVMAGQMNDQRMSTDPSARAQQMFNAQQSQQQQRMQHAAQQLPQQAQARANAQAKAQMALQGQPGGMGGSMPPQQSPAMPTLNTPLRPPSQQMNHPDGAMNASTQYGQALDPRFMQGSQRQAGPGAGMNGIGLSPALFASMPQEQQQRLMGLPNDKLNEVMAKWQEQQQRNQRMNTANAQGGRPPMPIQGNNQMRSGQPTPQPGQFDQQSAINRFMMANPGQRPPSSMTSGMSPQQQMMLQQQMQRLQQAPTQQRPGQPNVMTQESRALMQMDNVDFPVSLLNNHNVPQGIPPEAKKWGEVKLWAAHNPNLGPDAMEVLNTLQRMHYQNIMRARQNAQQASQQPIAVPPGQQAGLGGMPGVPPGMSAPVAPMGQVSMQAPNGMMGGQGMKKITQQDIQNLRNHPSGKFSTATDDQIRALLMRQWQQQQQLQQQQLQQRLQLTPQQIQHQRQQQQQQIQQMNNQASQANPQSVRQGIQAGQQNTQNQNSMGQGQPAQMPQQKQPVSAPEQPAPTTSGGRARSASNQRAGAQTSPTAPAPKNLKRVHSDDVVEIPNPHQQPPPRSAPQQPQGPKQAPHTASQPTPQQIANLDPEARKRYEQVRAMAAGARPQASADVAKLRAIMQDEQQQSSRESQPDIPMDPATKSAMVQSLIELRTPMINVTKALGKWYQYTHDDARARAFFRTRQRISKQFHDSGALTKPKDTFSMKPADIEQARAILAAMIKDLSDRFPEMKKVEATPSAPASQPPASQASAAPGPSPATVPLNAANLQQQQQQLKNMHQRNTSRSSNAPPAPNANPAQPFPLGPTPQRLPTYGSKAPLTQENLHIPPRKKQRPNAGTPGSNVSPHVAKAISPEVKKQPVPEPRPQPMPSLSCPEIDCERHNVGFDSEEALKRHTEEEHIKPLQNPSKYAQGNLANMLGLDSEGRPKKPATLPHDSITSSMKMVANGSTQGQTPKAKSGGTPGAQASPMNRQASGTKSSDQVKVKPDPAKDISRSKPVQKEPEKQQPQQPTPVDPWATTTIDPQDLFQGFQNFESGSGGAISDMNVYRSITPNDTPESSKDGASEPNSDISDGVALDITLNVFDENWKPFGPSVTDNSNPFFNIMDEDIDALLKPVDYPMDRWNDVSTQEPFIFDESFFSMTA